jgi:hypothetical protein
MTTAGCLLAPYVLSFQPVVQGVPIQPIMLGNVLYFRVWVFF